MKTRCIVKPANQPKQWQRMKKVSEYEDMTEVREGGGEGRGGEGRGGEGRGWKVFEPVTTIYPSGRGGGRELPWHLGREGGTGKDIETLILFKIFILLLCPV